MILPIVAYTDVVAAYKGLLKEKEALDASVAALSTNAPEQMIENNASQQQSVEVSGPNLSRSSSTSGGELNQQIATLMNSLATLSAEKSRMEASFQADKRQLRQELMVKDKQIKECHDKAKAAAAQSGLEVEKMKSKLIVERHARDKEINDHMVMVRELQKLLSDERHLKENLEMQLNDLKTQFSQIDNSDGRVRELLFELDQTKRKLKELKSSTKAAAAVITLGSSNSSSENASNILKQLQSEMVLMKQQHAIAIRNEQTRAGQAEERSKKLAVMHEDRVANLESRLAELSATVGNYDRLRQSDQDSIFKLKDKIAQLESNSEATVVSVVETRKWDINSLVDEISQLKKLLLIENAKQHSPQDLSKIFSTGNDHVSCIEEYEKLRIEYERYRLDSEAHHNTVEVQKSHIKTLQDKIQVLNRNIDDQEQELKIKSNEHFTELKTERSKWKELIASMEGDFRSKLSELEQQLQKQRERSLSLLEEKENEIKTLKTSFEIFIPGGAGNVLDQSRDSTTMSDDEKQQKTSKLTANHLSDVLTTGSVGQQGTAGGEYHMLHYVHELSRKEVEITSLRKAKHAAESSLRQALQDKVTSQQELHDRIGNLEDNVDR